MSSNSGFGIFQQSQPQTVSYQNPYEPPIPLNVQQLKKQHLKQEYDTQLMAKQQRQQLDIQEKYLDSNVVSQQKKFYEDDVIKAQQQRQDMKTALNQSYQNQLEYSQFSKEKEKLRMQREELESIQNIQNSLQQEEMKKQQRKEQQRRQLMGYYSQQTIQDHVIQDLNQIKKQEFIRINQENAAKEVMKDENYKRYYQQFNEQQQMKEKNFVSFNANQDQRYEEYISKNLGDNKMGSEQQQYIKRQQMYQMTVKEGLKDQINQKEREKYYLKQTSLKDNNDFQNRRSQQATQLRSMQQYRQKEEKDKYRQVLEVQLRERQELKRQIVSSTQEPGYYTQSNTLVHNPVTNPMPVTVQNPYIIKQLMSNTNRNPNQMERVNYATLASSIVNKPYNQD